MIPVLLTAVTTPEANTSLIDAFSGSNIDRAKWIVTDTESKITVTNGQLAFSGGKDTPAWSDPALVSIKPLVRRAGLTLECQITPSAANTELLIGFTDGTLAADAAEAHGIYLKDTGGVSVIVNAATGIVTPTVYTATSLWARIVCLASGALYYISTDNKITWNLVWIDRTVTTATLYAFIESYNAALTADKMEVKQSSISSSSIRVFTPSAPTLSLGDETISNGGFASDATGWTAFNASLASVVDGQSGNCLEVTKSVAGGASNATQTPTTVVGTWFLISGYIKAGTQGNAAVALGLVNNAESAWVSRVTGTSSANWAQLAGAGRSTETNNKFRVEQTGTGAGTSLFDTISLKPLAFSTASLLTYLGQAQKQNGVHGVAVTPSAGYQQGVVCHANSATAPTYCLLAYYDRTAGKAYLLKQDNGTWTELKSAAITYAAGAEIRIVSNGTSHAAYYNGSIVDSVQTSLDTSAWGLHEFYFSTENLAGGLAESIG